MKKEKEIVGKCFILETPDDLKVLCYRKSIYSLQSWSSELNGENIFLFWGTEINDFKEFLMRSNIARPTPEVIKELENFAIVDIKIIGKEAEIL